MEYWKLLNIHFLFLSSSKSVISFTKLFHQKNSVFSYGRFIPYRENKIYFKENLILDEMLNFKLMPGNPHSESNQY